MQTLANWFSSCFTNNPKTATTEPMPFNKWNTNERPFLLTPEMIVAANRYISTKIESRQNNNTTEHHGRKL